MCTCRPLLPALHRPTTPSCGTAPCPSAICRSPTSPSTPGQWDELRDPGRSGVPVPQLGAGPHGRLLSRPGRRDRVRAAARRLGPDRRARTRAGGCSRPDVEALLDPSRGPRRDEFSCHLVPIDACYELVGRLRLLWRGFDGGPEARTGDRRVLRRRGGAQPTRAHGGGDPMTEFEFSVLDIFAEPYAVAPQLTARLRIEESHRRSRSTRSPCAARCGSSRSAGATTGRGGRPARPVRRPRALAATPSSRSCGCSATPWCRASPGATEVDLPLPCTYDFEVTGSKYLHALRRRHGARSRLLFSGTVFTRGSRGFGVEQVPWDCEASYDLPVAVWRR